MVSKESLILIGSYIGVLESSELRAVLVKGRSVIFYYNDKSIAMSYKTLYDVVDELSSYKGSKVVKASYAGAKIK